MIKPWPGSDENPSLTGLSSSSLTLVLLTFVPLYAGFFFRLYIGVLANLHSYILSVMRLLVLRQLQGASLVILKGKSARKTGLEGMSGDLGGGRILNELESTLNVLESMLNILESILNV